MRFGPTKRERQGLDLEQLRAHFPTSTEHEKREEGGVEVGELGVKKKSDFFVFL